MMDYSSQIPEGSAQLAQWQREGKVKFLEHIVDGLENFPAAFETLFNGGNTGKNDHSTLEFRNNTMTQHAKDLCVNLDDFRQVSIRTSFPVDETQLNIGEVMIAIDRVALTANSVSYALAGRSGLMRFLDVFPAPEGEGRIPCWGYGEVVFSKHPEVKVG